MELHALDPQTLTPLGSFPIRPGLTPVSVQVTSSNTAVIPNPPAFVFNPGASASSLNVTAHAAASTTLSITTPAGFATPSTGATLTITAH